MADEQHSQESASALTSMMDQVSKAAQQAGGFLQEALINKLKELRDAALEAGPAFEKSMSQIQTLTGAAGRELDQLAQKAREMGAATQYSSMEAVDALSALTLAGWDTQEAVSSLASVMNLAAASGLELEESSQMTASALEEMGLRAEDAAHFTDVLAKAASVSRSPLSQMAEGFQEAAGLAGTLRYSLEDTASALALLALQGVRGQEAGASLQAMLSSLSDPSRETARAMETLGISLEHSDGSMKSLSGLMDGLREKFRGLSDSQREMAASALAGQEGMSAILAITGAGEQEFQSLTSQISLSNGAAQEMADTLQDNLQGSLSRLKSSAEELGIAAYDSLGGVLQGAADGASSALQYVGRNFDDVGRTVGILAAGLGVYKLAMWASTAAATAGVTATSALAAAQGALSAVLSANPVGLAILLLTGAVAGIAAVVDAANVTVEEQKQKVQEASQAYQEAANSLETLNGKLKSTQSRIKELELKGSLTFVEQQELDKLREVSQELQIQADLAQKKADLARRDLQKEQQALYGKTYGDKNFSQSQVEDYLEHNEITVNLESDQYDVAALIAAYTRYKALREEALSLGDTEDAAQQMDNMRDMEALIYQNAGAMAELKAQMESLPEADRTPETLAAMEQLEQGIHLVYQNLDPAKWAEIQFSSLLNAEGIRKTRDSLMELALQGGLTAEALNLPEYTLFREKLDQAGISTEAAAAQLNALALSEQAASDGAGRLGDIGTKSTGELVKALSELSSAFDLLKKAQDEASQSGKLSAGTLQALANQFPEMDDAIQAHLSGMISEGELLEKLAAAYQKDQQAYREATLDKMKNNQGFYQTLLTMDGAFLQDMARNYGVDLANCKTYAQAKAQLEKDLIYSIGKNWADYYDAEAGMMTQKAQRILENMPHSSPEYQEAAKAQEQIAKGQSALKEFQTRISALVQVEVDFEPAPASSAKGAASAGSRAGKDYSKALLQGIRASKVQIDQAVEGIAEEAAKAALEEAGDFQSAGSLYADCFQKGLDAKVKESQDEVRAFVDAQVGALSQSNQGAAELFQAAGKEVADAYAQAVAGNAEKAKKAVQESISAVTQEAQAQYDSLIQQRDALASRLADYGDLFTVTERTEEKNGATETFWEVQKADMEQRLADLNSYYDRLEQLRDRGASQEIISEIMELDHPQGMALMDSLLGESQEEFQAFVERVGQLQNTAREKAAEFYQGEIDQLGQDFTQRIGQAMASVPELVKGLGINASEGFVEGLASRLEDISGQGQQVASSVLSALQTALDCDTQTQTQKRAYSRETEAVGVSAADGLAIGMENQREQTDAAAQSMGSQLVSGLWLGVEGQEGWLMQQIQGFCARVVGEFQNSFDIHSPSRLMKNLIGKNLVSGIEAGLEDQTPHLMQTSQRQTNAVVQRMREAVQEQNASFAAAFSGTFSHSPQNVSREKGDVSMVINNNCPKTISRADQRRNLLQISAQLARL